MLPKRKVDRRLVLGAVAVSLYLGNVYPVLMARRTPGQAASAESAEPDRCPADCAVMEGA